MRVLSAKVPDDQYARFLEFCQARGMTASEGLGRLLTRLLSGGISLEEGMPGSWEELVRQWVWLRDELLAMHSGDLPCPRCRGGPLAPFRRGSQEGWACKGCGYTLPLGELVGEAVDVDSRDVEWLTE